MQIRLKILGLGFLIVFIGLFFKLFEWQIVKGSSLSREAKNQYVVGKSVSAPRGNILSFDRTPLVGEGEAWLVYFSIPDLKEPPKIVAGKIAPYFVEDQSDIVTITEEAKRIESLIIRKGSVWVPVKQSIETEVKEKIENLNIEGIGFERREKRIYSEASSAAHLLGFVGKNKDGDDQGYFGLEGYYDISLAGKPGYLARDSDALGRPIPIGETEESSPIRGVDLITYVDKGIQIEVEQTLKEGIEKYGAKSGSAVIMDPKTGGIIAMASFPSFNPAKYFDYGNEYFKNPIVSDSFEPGSIFKVIVMASALDAQAIDPNTKCDICSGPLKIDKYTIETWNNKYFPESTMTDVIVHSDNVGMSFVSNKLGIDKMYDYLTKFGIGETTGIDLQGEISVPMREKQTWNVVDLATSSFGQGIAVTPIQMVRAVGAIANNGVIVTPRVVNKLKRDKWEEDVSGNQNKKIISEEAAQQITQMMVEAVKYGEAKWTSLRGFSVAGKTGTAQIPIAGHYDPKRTNASFIGFAPSNDPKFVMLVMLKEPSTSQWASETAAPVWFDIAKKLFLHLKIQPEN